ncbi:MAG: bifunctional chorismate mutase/prephenate dehydratase, partial [Eubacterium sp.]|nr:bifunctional chorismate mutase/prephenate dehydratase [Eubacterium sp.]
TRFIVISKELIIDDNADKISLIFSAPHTTGSLYRVLGRFSMAGLSLTKLESRPIENQDFNYHFYVDVMGSVRDNSTLDLMCALYDELPEFEFLGNFFESR